MLLELNSLRLCPISIIAFMEGASFGVIGAAWASPTTSNRGAMVFTMTVTISQNRMIGTANSRIACARNGSLACSVLVSVMRTSPGKRFAR